MSSERLSDLRDVSNNPSARTPDLPLPHCEESATKDKGMASHTTIAVEIEEPDTRQVIYMDDPKDKIDFVTLHNILYYLYTGCVNLHLGDPGPISLPEGYSDKPDAFMLYQCADKLLLDSLTQRCFRYLKASMTPLNISERLFCSDLQHFNKLRDMYLQYLFKNWKEVRESPGWEDIVTNKQDVGLPARIYQEGTLLEITKRLEFRLIT